MACKITAFFSDHKAGWSESFYHTGDDPGIVIEPVVRVPDGIMVNRLKLAGAGVTLDAVRASNVDAQRDGVLRELDWSTVDGHRLKIKAESDSFCDVAWTGVLIRLANSPSIKGHIFMRGMPDSMISGNPRQFVPSKAWEDRFAIWKEQLKTYSLRVRKGTDETPRRNILEFTKPDATSNVRIKTSDSLTPAANEFVYVTRGKYKTPGYHWPAGAFKVLAVTGQTNLYELSGTATAVPSDLSRMAEYVSGSAKAQVIGYRYPTILFADIGNVVERKAGRPFGGLVGRRRK